MATIVIRLTAAATNLPKHNTYPMTGSLEAAGACDPAVKHRFLDVMPKSPQRSPKTGSSTIEILERYANHDRRNGAAEHARFKRIASHVVSKKRGGANRDARALDT